MFHQTLVHDGDLRSSRGRPGPRANREGDAGRILVTYLPAADVDRPMAVGGRVVLEPRSPVVWFTFPGARHDIGRFHTPDGRFTGWYANILTPVEIEPATEDAPEVWRTTDLFLDLFVTPGGTVELLDQDELGEAARRGWIDPDTARVAEEEARRLVDRAGAGDWPPPVVEEWTLERARAVAAGPERA